MTIHRLTLAFFWRYREIDLAECERRRVRDGVGRCSRGGAVEGPDARAGCSRKPKAVRAAIPCHFPT